MLDWNRANKTELLQACRDAEISASPGLPKETLIQLLLGKVEEEEVPGNPIDSWREAMMDFLLDHWTTMRVQTCGPARDLECWAVADGIIVRRKPGLPPGKIACRTCTDAQVMCCIVQHPKSEPLIECRRKK